MILRIDICGGKICFKYKIDLIKRNPWIKQFAGLQYVFKKCSHDYSPISLFIYNCQWVCNCSERNRITVRGTNE